MTPDLRIIFLFLALVTLILFTLRRGGGALITFADIGQILVDFLLVPAVVGTVGAFVFLLARQDPMPLIREAAYQLSFQQLVSYAKAIPANLGDNLAVAGVLREDTDGDNFREWVVFYEFDLGAANNPIQAVIYDNDRGNPPVIFPYALRPPDRDYLSEDASIISFGLNEVTIDRNGPGGSDLPEVLVEGKNELSIFRFRENSEIWDFPRDAPPRYEPIGFFRGSGGVSFDPETKNVTVIDRDGFERSQLAARSIYALNERTNSYLDIEELGADGGVKKLSAPIFSTIDFFAGPPDDILDTTFPEKVVLAFYAATCGGEDNPFCPTAKANWQSQDFLTGDALKQFTDGNPDFFGLPGFGGIQNLAITELRYYPSKETDADLLVSGGGRDVVTGEEAQLNVVEVNFTADSPVETARQFKMTLVNGQWKIAGPADATVSGTPTEISAPEQ